ncbi:hypothetical protein RFI_37014, partial [Reticulomyxa filosa]
KKKKNYIVYEPDPFKITSVESGSDNASPAVTKEEKKKNRNSLDTRSRSKHARQVPNGFDTQIDSRLISKERTKSSQKRPTTVFHDQSQNHNSHSQNHNSHSQSQNQNLNERFPHGERDSARSLGQDEEDDDEEDEEDEEGLIYVRHKNDNAYINAGNGRKTPHPSKPSPTKTEDVVTFDYAISSPQGTEYVGIPPTEVPGTSNSSDYGNHHHAHSASKVGRHSKTDLV